jgi:hypothetical protein
MTSAVLAGREVVDVAGVPVRCRGNLWIRASAISVNPGDDTMITIFETDIDRIDLLGGGQGSIQQLAALLRSEEGRVGGCGPRKEPKRGCHRVDEVLRIFDAIQSGLGNLLL